MGLTRSVLAKRGSPKPIQSWWLTRAVCHGQMIGLGPSVLQLEAPKGPLSP